MTEYLPGLISGLVVAALWVLAIWFAVALARANRADAEEEGVDTVSWEEICEQISNMPWYESLYYACYRFANEWLNPMSLGRKIGRFFQRCIYGFDDSEVWGLYHAILRFIAPRLRALSKMDKMGVPLDIVEEVYANYGISYAAYEEGEDVIPAQAFDDCWNEKLNKMTRAIELYLEHDGIFRRGEGFSNKSVPAPELQKEFDEGWELFKHYFFALWD